MRTGPAILLFRGRGFISRLIRWQTRGDFSHAAFWLPGGPILESWQGAGVRVKTLDDWSNVTVFDVPSATADQWASALSFAMGQVGKGYDYIAIARFLSRGNSKDNDRWFCSELVFDAMQQAGVNLLERVEGWAVSPALLSMSPLLVKRI